MSRSSLALGERVATVVLWSAALGVIAVFAWLLVDLAGHGLSRLSFEFLTAAPRNAGREGGLGPILVSTALILLVCMATALPLGLGTAILLAEFTAPTQRFGRLVRRSLDVLAGVPSIVFGLFGNVFFCQVLGLGFSILAGGLTLACMVLPILIRATEEGLRAVSDEHRRNAAALGLSRAATIAHLLLPAAMPSLLAGWILGVGRAAAETAALMFTSGYVDRMPESLLDSGRALTIHIYDLSMNVPGGNETAAASALVLIALLLLCNVVSAALASRWLPRRSLAR